MTQEDARASSSSYLPRIPRATGEAAQRVSKPKILVIGPTPPPAHGVAVYTQTLLNSDLVENFQIFHLDISDRRTLANVGKFDVRNALLALRHGLQFLWLLVSVRPQIIYLPLSEMKLGFVRDCLFLIPARLFRRRVVVHLHGGFFDTLYANSNLVLRWFTWFCLSRVTLTIVLGESFRSKLEGLVRPERVRVVRCGIGPEIFEAAKRGSGQRKNGKRRVLYLGTLVESKGFLDLVYAIPQVVKEVQDVEFLFVGDDSLPEARAAKEWVLKNSLSPFVRFLGPRYGAEKVQHLLAATILAFPTWYPLEGQPIVLIEAMSAGLPILTTRHATIPEILGEDGALYVKQRDPIDIAEKLCILLRDEELQRKIGQTNQQRFLQSHTVERLCGRLGEVFEEAL